ncbi:hypothetical protein GT352_27950 [Streptomyces sp. SID1046]|uniref:hypothetical protein n=1 Tax=Streptomyces sp. SID1046 TaxID=2690249 RepID=UPI00136C03B8|nr:hypothetical protein [Streptomyces sp. SID1046]MYV77734.1 hypothetical protein [Streptomyces sp. SID1046]
MADAQFDARIEAGVMRDALNAAREQRDHMHQVFGGWGECAPCEKANDECDGTFACDAYRKWQKKVETGSRVETAIDQLLATLAEAHTKLEIAERQNQDLDAKLTERTQQLNGLLAALDYDEKAIPA